MPLKRLCKCLFFAAILPLATSYGDTNLLTNPGFEDGTTGWHAFAGCKFTTSATVYRSGTSSGHAYKRTQAYQGIAQSLLGKMEAGKTYHLTAWVKLEGASANGDTIKATIKKVDDSGTFYDWVSTSTVYSDQWSQLSGQYTLTVDGELIGLDIYFEGPVADVNFYVDDVNLFTPSAVPADPNTTGKVDAATHYQKTNRLAGAGTCDAYQLTIHARKKDAYDMLSS